MPVKKQTRGVEQINIAVSQMDKVTQNIASTAEEGAASAEELEAQAMSMKKIVEELEMIVHGTVSNAGEEYYEKRQIKRDSNMYTPKRKETKNIKPVIKEKIYKKSKDVSPEDIIPLDEDFQDF